MTARVRAMKKIALALVLTMSPFATANAGEPEQIPLDQIWAYEMPGTQSITDLAEPHDEMFWEALMESWFGRASRLKFKNVARFGFVVPGDGLSALRIALAVFIQDGPFRGKLTTGEGVTLVFFSEPGGRYRPQIRQIRRKQDTIEILYWLQPELGGYPPSLALIPLGKLPAGKYDVHMLQVARELHDFELELGFKPLDKEWSRNFVCKPYSFTVAEQDK
jgi:hypothetical protein